MRVGDGVRDSKGIPPELKRALASGIKLTAGPKVDRFIGEQEDRGLALVAAHMLTESGRYRAELVKLQLEAPDPKVASYLALTSQDNKEAIVFAKEAVRLDPDNSVSYLIEAYALKRAGDPSFKVSLDSALRASVCDTNSKLFQVQREAVLAASKIDEGCIVAARVHNQWNRTISDLLQPLIIGAPDTTLEDTAAAIALVSRMREDIPADDWISQDHKISAAEISLLQRLPPDWQYDDDTSVELRIEELSQSRRRSLARLSEASQALQSGSRQQAKIYFLKLKESGLGSALDWLLGPDTQEYPD
jgi:hypothetical protein